LRLNDKTLIVRTGMKTLCVIIGCLAGGMVAWRINQFEYHG
jgi:hypothetical protein